ncbi:hypothetical protein [uncultured Treponema sp.]|uniref:tetratricopeptide repeat protein n=1 Tax=uncultured Treponema sp. TaxID=162155 RepID=UPI0025FB0D18|nr:hypothetical protein [uncultured Treponema sp.]
MFILRKTVHRTFFLALFMSNALFLNAQKVTSRPVCTAITAQKTGINKIQLTWNIPENFTAASIAIFRSTSQIEQKSTVSAEKPIAEVPAHTTSYTDTLKHFGDYYYALIARDKEGNLFNMLFPTVNATVKPVSLIPPDDYLETEPENEAQYIPGFLRELPLPYLDLISDLDIQPAKLSQKAKDEGKKLAGKYAVKKPKLLSPYIFEEDMIASPQGDDFFLFESLKTYFIKKDYKGSVKDLRNFLSITREPFVTTRAVFYLAQSQYYCKNYRKALELFLFVEDELPELSKKWIDSTLDFYKIKA